MGELTKASNLASITKGVADGELVRKPVRVLRYQLTLDFDADQITSQHCYQTRDNQGRKADWEKISVVQSRLERHRTPSVYVLSLYLPKPLSIFRGTVSVLAADAQGKVVGFSDHIFEGEWPYRAKVYICFHDILTPLVEVSPVGNASATIWFTDA